MTSSNNTDKMYITFWGTRGSVSTPGRITEKYGGNTPCVSVSCQDIRVIFDAGTGIRNLGMELLEEIKENENPPSLHLFLSHTHWDHIQGLPFFMPSYHKNTKLTIYGSPYKGGFLESILKEQMDYEYFPVSMSAFPANIKIREISEEIIRLGPLTVEWQEQVHHPGGSVRYKVNFNGKKVVYATDVELNNIFNEKKNSEENRRLAREYIGFISDADLLIADGQYTEDEYPDKVGWGHSSIPVLLDTAFRSNVRQVAIFHHDPQHSDKFLDELWIKNRAIYRSKSRKMDLFWAREGMTLAI
jgi:phosphoribosyl 1,2-cyclic phosphodiesterase